MRFVTAVPWFPAGMAVTVVLGALLGSRVARRLGAPTALGWILILSLGLVLAATLTPQREALDYGAISVGSCDLSRMGLAPLSAFRGFNDTSVNILVFLPLGTAIGLIPRSRAKAAVVGAAILLPFAIELTQLLVPALDRGCQSADVIDNLTGLAVGSVVGSFAGWLGARLSAP